MRVELTHDIIALKIWEQLPEQDKQLRLVNNSLNQRLADYNREEGALLGEKELLAWEDFFPLLDLTSSQQIYIEKSKNALHRAKLIEQEQQKRELRLTQQKLALEQKARRRQRVYLGVFGLLALVATLTSISANESRKKEQLSAEIAVSNARDARLSVEELGDVLQDQTKKRCEELLQEIQQAKDNFKYDLLIEKAIAIKTTISENQQQIAKVPGSQEVLTAFKETMEDYSQEAAAYINTFTDSLNYEKLTFFAQSMNKVQQSLVKNEFDATLFHLGVAEKLNLDMTKEDINVKKQEIYTKGFNYYNQKAQYNFKNNRSKRGKYINPYQLYLKAQKYGNALQNNEIEEWFKNKFCRALIQEYEYEKYDTIQLIVQICKND